MTPLARPAPTADADPGWSLKVTVPLAGLVDWSDDAEDCPACHWSTRPVTRTALGDRWGGPCPYHSGVDQGAREATDWHPDDHPGRLGWRRAARALAAVLLAASRGEYTRASRRADRDAVRSWQ